MEILRSSETKFPILKTELPILGRQFQNERTVRIAAVGHLTHKVYLLSPSGFRVSFDVSICGSHMVSQLLRHQRVTQKYYSSLQGRVAEMYLSGDM